MKRPRIGSTIKQVAYATRVLGGAASSKKEAALLSGYSMGIAKNAKTKIETTEGYKNALLALHTRSTNLVNKILVEFELRGFDTFSNKDLISAVNAVVAAWDKIDTKRAPTLMKDPTTNPLRKVFTERVETRSISIEPMPDEPVIHEQPAESADAPIQELPPPDDPNDF